MRVHITTSRQKRNSLLDRYASSSLINILAIASGPSLYLLVVIRLKLPGPHLSPHSRQMILSRILDIGVVTLLAVDNRDLYLHHPLNGLHLPGLLGPLVHFPAGEAVHPAICPSIVGSLGHQLNRVILMLDVL